MSLHLKLLDIDHLLNFEKSKLRQIEAHALIYLRTAGGQSVEGANPVSMINILCYMSLILYN